MSAPQPAAPKTAPVTAPFDLSPEKQRKIEALCDTLFRRADWVASGKLQMLGLGAVKRSMGRRWARLAPRIYRIVEDAIKKYGEKDDLSFRYKEDCYMIIFADADLESTQARALLIKREIERGLSQLNEPALKTLKLETTVRRTPAAQLVGKKLDQTIPFIFYDPSPSPALPEKTIEIPAPPPPPAPSPLVFSTLEIEPPKAAHAPAEKHEQLPEHAYIPIWDVQKKMLTTYVPVLKDPLPLDSLQQKAYADRLILRMAGEELARMESDGRKLFIACPVHYDTLSRFETYTEYKALCQNLPANQQQFLIFTVIRPHIRAEPYQFMQPLRQHSRHIFAQLSNDPDINTRFYQETGFEALSFQIDNNLPESISIQQMTILHETVKRTKMQTMVTGVDSLSLMTSIVCAGFDYIGGDAIHALVPKPDSVYRCNHEDIVLALLAR